MEIIFYVILVLGVVGVMLSSYFLGERHKERATDFPYESGIMVTGNARIRFPVHFYLIAMFFVIFDVEAVFIIIWSVALKELGLYGLMHITFFIVTLLLALFYLLKRNALSFVLKGGKYNEDT